MRLLDDLWLLAQDVDVDSALLDELQLSIMSLVIHFRYDFNKLYDSISLNILDINWFLPIESISSNQKSFSLSFDYFSCVVMNWAYFKLNFVLKALEVS